MVAVFEGVSERPLGILLERQSTKGKAVGNFNYKVILDAHSIP